MYEYPKYIQELIAEFSKLPGIGYKTAVRLSMYIINKDTEEVMKFYNALKNCKEEIKYCNVCSNFSEDEKCYVCLDKLRDSSTICVVESVKDLYAFEKTKNYNGVYHVLHGVISPSKGVSFENLNLNSLFLRINNDNIKEVIIATNPTLEGEATSIYISKILFEKNIKVTRLAYGIPLGSDLEHVDEVTLARALKFRQKI